MKSDNRTPSSRSLDRIGSLPPRRNLMSGFPLGAGVGRPVATLHAGHSQVTVRLARIGTDVIELAAEAIGLDEFRDVRCQLYVPEADVHGLAGRVTLQSEQTAVFEIETPTVATATRLFDLVTGPLRDERLVTIPPPSETISDPAGVRSVLRGLIINNAPSRIRAQSADWLLQAREVTDKHIVWDLLDRGGLPTSPLMVEASGYSASYQLPVLMGEETSTRLVTTIPSRIERVRRRRMPRVSARGELVARFIHPTYHHPVECSIVDVSDHGIGLSTDHQTDLLCPGLVIPNLVVLRHGREMAQLYAKVQTVGIARSKAGVTVYPEDDTAARLWSRLVRELLHDRTRSWGYTPDALWDLYEAAGYLNLSGKTPEDFLEMKAAFADATRRLAMAPEIGYHVVWPSSTGADAATTNVLTYSRAHLGFHMAKRPGKTVHGAVGKEMLREIHWHALEEALASNRSDWWIGYVQSKTRFSNLLMPDFQARFRDSVRECVVPFRAYQIACGLAQDQMGVEKAVATEGEINQLCESIRTSYPLPYWESQDLTPERMSLEALTRAWGRVGLQRRRVVLVSREEGVPKAALIADLGHPGLHVYGLLDVARFFPLASDAATHRKPLLELAKTWYARFGRKQFSYFHEADEPLAEEPGTTDMGTASLCVISMDLVPDLLDYLFENMSWDPKDSMPPPPTRSPSGELPIPMLVDLVEAARRAP